MKFSRLLQFGAGAVMAQHAFAEPTPAAQAANAPVTANAPAVSAANTAEATALSTPAASPVAATTATPPQAAIIETPAQENILRAGTEIPLVMREELTTKKKKLRTGQRFQMEVASNITKNGIVVIPVGTPAVGEITEVRNKGMWGKSGYIGARVISMRLGDRQVRISGTFDDKGVTGTGGVVASIALIPLAGFFTTGTSAVIPNGGGVKAFLDEDIAFRPAAPQPQPIEAPAAPAPAPAAPQAPASN